MASPNQVNRQKLAPGLVFWLTLFNRAAAEVGTVTRSYSYIVLRLATIMGMVRLGVLKEGDSVFPNLPLTVLVGI